MNRAAGAQRAPFRLPGVPKHVQEYLLCILFHLLFPYFPFLVEGIVRGSVEDRTLFLFLAVYPLSIGASSRNRLLFGFAVMICLFYSVFFGLVSGKIELPALISQIGCVCILAAGLLHAGERYNRHVTEEQSFWKFA